jgi:hypothetical protein
MNTHENQFVEVQVVTTAGMYPNHGFDRVPAHQNIKNQLQEAAKKLKITNTDGWIVVVAGREIDVNKSYIDNALHGQVVLDWGPREGGGGARHA